MQHLEVSGAVRPLQGSLGVKGLTSALDGGEWIIFKPRPLYRPKNTTGTNHSGGWIRPTAHLDVLVRKKCPSPMGHEPRIFQALAK